MGEPFESARRKLARAKFHIKDLEERIAAFEQSNTYETICEPDPEKPEELVHKIRPTILLADTSEIAGDAVNNLREALDHAAYAVSRPPRKRCYFPFGDPAEFVRKKSRGWSEDVPEEIFSLFRSFKPYKGGNDLLWALNQICIANKHTLLTSVAINARRTSDPTIGYGKDAKPFWISFPPIRWDTSKQEVIVARSSMSPDAQFQCSITTFIAFNDVEVVRDQEAISVLYALVSVVDGILWATESEARRLGFVS